MHRWAVAASLVVRSIVRVGGVVRMVNCVLKIMVVEYRMADQVLSRYLGTDVHGTR